MLVFRTEFPDHEAWAQPDTGAGELLWYPPGLEPGGEREAGGYLIDALPRIGNGLFQDGCSRFVPETVERAAIPASTADEAITAPYPGWSSTVLNWTLPYPAEIAGGITLSKAAKYGGPVRCANFHTDIVPTANNIGRDSPLSATLYRLACDSDGSVVFGPDQWTGASDPFMAAGAVKTVLFAADGFASFAPTQTRAHPHPCTMRWIGHSVATSRFTRCCVSVPSMSSYATSINDQVIGLHGSAKARVRIDVQFYRSAWRQAWRNLFGFCGQWSGGPAVPIPINDSSPCALLAPVLVADRPCEDFAFDVTLPAPIGNAKIVYSCANQPRSPAHVSDTADGMWYTYSLAKTAAMDFAQTSNGTPPLLLIPALVGGGGSTPPYDGCVRSNRFRPITDGFAGRYGNECPFCIAGSTYSLRDTAFSRLDGNIASWEEIDTPAPAATDLPQFPASVTVVFGKANEGTDVVAAWGCWDNGAFVPCSAQMTTHIPGNFDDNWAPPYEYTVSVPPPVTLPISGAKYVPIFKRVVNQYDNRWSGDYTVTGTAIDDWAPRRRMDPASGGAYFIGRYTGMVTTFRPYPFDVRLHHGLPSSADATPCAVIGWRPGGDGRLVPASTPTPTGAPSLIYSETPIGRGDGLGDDTSYPPKVNWRCTADGIGIDQAPSPGTGKWLLTWGHHRRIVTDEPVAAFSGGDDIRVGTHLGLRRQRWQPPAAATTATLEIRAPAACLTGADVSIGGGSFPSRGWGYSWTTVQWSVGLSI